MHITNIEVVNFRCIERFERAFNGGVYLFKGDNEVGKSSLLEVIRICLTGERSDNNLRKGAVKGRAAIDLGEDYRVEFKFSNKNERGNLVVTRKSDGMQADSITALQKLFGYTDFDAAEFIKWSETAEGRRKQIAVIDGFLTDKQKEEVVNFDAAIQKLEADRLVVGRDAKQAEGAFTSMSIPEGEPQEPVDVAELAQQLTPLQKEQAAYNQMRHDLVKIVEEGDRVKQKYEQDVAAHERQFADDTAELDRILKRAEELRAKLDKSSEYKDSLTAAFNTQRAERRAQYNALKGKVEGTPDPAIKIQEVQAKLENAGRINATAHKHQAYNEAKAHAFETVKKYATLQETIERMRESRKAVYTSAKLPVSGLTVTEDGLYFDGRPFREDTLSTSQVMDITARVLIACNPKVKVFRVAQGESLGAAKLKALADFAEANGFQGFIEDVVRGVGELVIEEYTETGN